MDALAAFRAYLEDALAAAVAAARADQALLIDGAVSAAGANAALVETIARAGPFGAGNPEPVVALPAHHGLCRSGRRGPCPRGFARRRPMLNAIAFRAAASRSARR